MQSTGRSASSRRTAPCDRYSDDDIATVFTLEVVDPAYDMEETGEVDNGGNTGLPLGAIIGIAAGGSVIVLAGAFCIVWFLVLKKGKKPEAKAAE